MFIKEDIAIFRKVILVMVERLCVKPKQCIKKNFSYINICDVVDTKTKFTAYEIK